MFLHIYILSFIPALWAVQSVKIYRKVFRDKRVSDQIFSQIWGSVSPWEFKAKKKQKFKMTNYISSPWTIWKCRAKSKKYMRLLHFFSSLVSCCMFIRSSLIVAKEHKAPPCLIPPSQTFASFFPSPNHLSLLLIAKRQTTRMLGWDGFIMG